MHSTAVLVPVKGFDHAKERLAAALGRAERAQLAHDLAAGVVRAAAPWPAAVVCDDPGVAEFAREHGASIIWRPGVGLSGAVASAVRALAHFGEVVVAHGDLARPGELRELAGFDGITLVPDRHGDGTNVIVVPPGCGFTFAYGPGSFARHHAEAARRHRNVRVLADTYLSYDIDTPADLEAALPCS